MLLSCETSVFLCYYYPNLGRAAGNSFLWLSYNCDRLEMSVFCEHTDWLTVLCKHMEG